MSSPTLSNQKGKQRKRAQLTSVPVTSSASKSRKMKSPSAKSKSKAAPESATFGRQIPLDVDDDSDSDSDSSDDSIIHVTIKKRPPAVAAMPSNSNSTTSGTRPRSADRKRGARVSTGSNVSPVKPRTLHVDTATTTTRPSRDDDDDDDDNDTANSIPPTTQELSCLCWKCRVTLKMPNSPNEFCNYAMHVHPVLQVPVCIVCSEEIAKHEISQQTSSPPSEDDICHGCAEETWDDLLLCDRCPRQFCTHCVAQAYGGGTKGLQRADQLTKDEDDWMCLVCDPHPALQKLQAELDGKSSNGDTLSLSQDSANNNNDSSHAQAPASKRRSVEEILEELDWVEGEHKAQEQWDDPKALEAKRKEIAEEIRQKHPNLSSEQVNARVEEEMNNFIKELGKHDKRLGDMAVSLQEELEVVHGMDLAKVYQKVLGAKIHDDDDEGEEMESPSWKRKADEEIRKRDMENRHITLPNISSPSVYDREDYGEVEDLLTRPEDELDRDCMGEGFRSTRDRPTQKQIEAAMQTEDEALAQKKIRIRCRVDNDADKQETMDEENLTSKHGSDGVTRVRRDTFVALLEARPKKRAPRPPRPPIREETKDDEAPSNAAVAPLQQHPDPPKFPPLASEPKADPDSVDDDECVDLTADTPSPFVHRKPKPAPVAKKTKKALDFEFESESDDASACQVVDPKDEYYESTEAIYAKSQLVLSSPKNSSFKSDTRVKHIAVCTSLEKNLKPHQKEGVQFMWRNACIDLNVRTSKDQKLREDKDVGGCILAHSMGLGKSLSTISLLHTLLNHPSLTDQKRRGRGGIVFTAMLIVPVNTIASWEAEFKKWTRELKPSILVYGLAEHKAVSRGHVIDQWSSNGGVLLVSKDNFARCAKAKPSLLVPGPDVVVIDEAHLCLSNKDTALYKCLDNIRTKRRILLTGSPFQNNAKEYFTMVQWIRPEALSCTEAEFDTNFSKPIMAGLPSDATEEERKLSVLKSAQLNKILDPFVHRRDEHVLRAFLPQLSQVVIHVRQSKFQTKLYRALKRYEDQHDITNCFRRFHHARPIHNHPACLLMQSRNEDDIEEAWWQKTVQKLGEDKLKSPHHGAKIVLLLHILTHSVLIGDKVVVFANCLKTLDFIQEILSLPCWSDHVKSLKSAFPDTELGGWSNGNDYLRIDGGVDSTKRGTLVAKFNNKAANVHCFLISAKAGGVGITLSSANRVVLFDNHFNPTVTTQAIFRLYRFGQTKPVYAYRFMTEGTGEEKIYSRSVNKSGLALRVVDGKSYQGAFTEEELSNLVLNDTWVQCESCEKWRMLPQHSDDEELPDKWYCRMNVGDRVNNTCHATEKDTRWYHNHFRLALVDVGDLNGANKDDKAAASAGEDDNNSTSTDDSDAKKEAMAKTDPILTKLLESESKTASNISKYYFHEALLEEREDDEDLPAVPEDESALLDLKPASKPSASTRVEAAPPAKPTFKEKFEARKRKDRESEKSSDAAKSSSAKIGKPKKHASTGSAEENGSSTPKKLPEKSSEGRAEKKSSFERKRSPTRQGERDASTGHRSSPKILQPRIKSENTDGTGSSPAKRKRGQENGPDDGSPPSPPKSRRHSPTASHEEPSISSSARKQKSRSRRKKSPMKPSQEVVELLLSSDEE